MYSRLMMSSIVWAQRSDDMEMRSATLPLQYDNLRWKQFVRFSRRRLGIILAKLESFGVPDLAASFFVVEPKQAADQRDDRLLTRAVLSVNREIAKM
jgi:hypothetical protein